jgi:hypothetical protein
VNAKGRDCVLFSSITVLMAANGPACMVCVVLVVCVGVGVVGCGGVGGGRCGGVKAKGRDCVLFSSIYISQS